ncbi:hypothetical protein Fcan01_16175 [Folsomia candida]|uniref:Uncharacterized protein n=1 Tax=Folsomia candida TaxID=158441 RepID=A0A226DTX4_FOLCA|nr:hypothetical protein Fcan01_16175 [Folsomia candida]
MDAPLSVFTVATAIAMSIVKNEYVAFINDLLGQIEQLETVAFPKRGNQFDKLNAILSMFVLVAATLPYFHGIFQAYMTVKAKFSHLVYISGNSTCQLSSFPCKFLTITILGTFMHSSLYTRQPVWLVE